MGGHVLTAGHAASEERQVPSGQRVAVEPEHGITSGHCADEYWHEPSAHRKGLAPATSL